MIAHTRPSTTPEAARRGRAQDAAGHTQCTLIVSRAPAATAIAFPVMCHSASYVGWMVSRGRAPRGVARRGVAVQRRRTRETAAAAVAAAPALGKLRPRVMPAQARPSGRPV